MRRRPLFCTALIICMCITLSTPVFAQEQQAETDTLDLILWHSVAVYKRENVHNRELVAGFRPSPGFEDAIKEAQLFGPQGNLLYTFNLEADYYDDRTDCAGSNGWWKHIDAPVTDGEYTFVFDFGQLPAQTTYSAELTTTPDEPQISNLTRQVNDNGSMTFAWDVDHDISEGDPYTYQVRLYDTDWNFVARGYYHLDKEGNHYTFQIPMHVLNCLDFNETYYGQLRAYSHNSNETYIRDTDTITYSPSNPQNRISWFMASDWNEALGLGFDVPKLFRDKINEAVVHSPNGDTHRFNIKSDWYDISSSTRLNKGWFLTVSDGVQSGTYELELTFSDDTTWSSNSTIDTPTEIVPVNIQTIDKHTEGQSLHISFDEPSNAPADQKYQLRIRSKDDTTEYYKSQMLDKPYFVFRPLALSPSYPYEDVLTPGTEYTLFVRNYGSDSFSANMRESDKVTVTYDPVKWFLSDTGHLSMPAITSLLLEE